MTASALQVSNSPRSARSPCCLFYKKEIAIKEATAIRVFRILSTLIFHPPTIMR